MTTTKRTTKKDLAERIKALETDKLMLQKMMEREKVMSTTWKQYALALREVLKFHLR